MKLGSLFSDGAVLQRNQPIRIWGETSPQVLVKAEIAGEEGYAKSSDCGEFLLTLPPLEAGGPFELTVSLPDDPAETVAIHDVLIGDVWLCSGQSNMQYRLNSDCAVKPPAPGEIPLSRQQEQEFLDTVCPAEHFRFITVPLRVTGCREKYFEGAWRPMTREAAPEASAVAAWFGAELHKTLQVPVGLICCSWGGSIVETWTSPAALRSNPDTRSELEMWEALRRKKETWTETPPSEDEQLRKIAKPDRGNQGFGRGWASPELDDSEWRTLELPGSWTDQELAGNGAVWVRKKVTVPAELAGHDLLLGFGGIDKHDIAYFNGVEVGRTGKELETQFWNQLRCYKVPGELVRAGENTVAVRAFSFALAGGFGPPDSAYSLAGENWSAPLSGAWKFKAEYDLGKITLPPRYWVGYHNTPGLLFDSMVRSLLPFALRGVIWYQGESNANSIRGARTYQSKLETMIRDWRFRFDQPELPFLQVQLADYHSPKAYDAFSAWAELRGRQERLCRTQPGVYLATALGVGDEADIHPQNKKDVGFRLAAAAMYHVYHHNVLPSGPVFREVRAEQGALRVFFDFADGLELRDAPEKSFYLAGADGRYFPADTAAVDGDSVLLASRQVPDPRSVRYAWSNNPDNILYNRQYPAAAFSSEEK